MDFSFKANISIQTFFFIMMSIFMVWIIIFGIQKLFLVDDTISEQNVLLFQKDIKEAFDYCSDPLNRGSFKLIEINGIGDKFNGVCLLGKKQLDESKYGSSLLEQLKTINDSGLNTVFIKFNLKYDSTTNKYEIINYDDFNIVKAFHSDLGNLEESKCYFNEIKIIC